MWVSILSWSSASYFLMDIISLFLSMSSLAIISLSSSTCASSLYYTWSLRGIFSLCLNSCIFSYELWIRVLKATLSYGFTPSFIINSLKLSFCMCRALDLALSFFNLFVTFSSSFSSLLMVIAFLLSSMYKISPTWIWKLILSNRGTLVKYKETSKALNWEFEDNDCGRGWCSEKFIWFFSKSIEAKSLV